MRGQLASLTMLVLLAACGQEEAPAPVEPEERAEDAAKVAEKEALNPCGAVTAEGYCGVRFGMPVAEAMGAFPVKLEGYEAREGTDLSPDRCQELFAVPPVTGVSFLAEKGVIGRVDVLTETVRTDDDFGVGTQALALRTRFGDALTVQTNSLEPEITDLSLMQGEAKFVFEIQDGVVRAWRAGVAPTIDYVAHCG